jgi:hypothetical protein
VFSQFHSILGEGESHKVSGSLRILNGLLKRALRMEYAVLPKKKTVTVIYAR